MSHFPWCNDEGLRGTAEAWSPEILSSTTQGELEGQKGSSHLGAALCPPMVADTSQAQSLDPDQHPFCRCEGPCFRDEVTEKARPFHGGCHRGGKQTQTSLMAHSRSKERFRQVGPGSTGRQMDPTGDHCMFPCSGSKTQAHKQRTGEGRGQGAWGPALVSHRRFCVCWGDQGNYLAREQTGLQLPEVEGGACSGDKTLTPGDLGSALESEP